MAATGIFDERETAYETKFMRDEEFRFQLMARRNKLLGLWAAALMGLEGEAALTYARQVIEADFKEPGDQDVLDKVLGDLLARGIAADAAMVRLKMETLAVEARTQLIGDSDREHMRG